MYAFCEQQKLILLAFFSVVGTAKLTAVHDKFLALEATKGSGLVSYTSSS